MLFILPLLGAIFTSILIRFVLLLMGDFYVIGFCFKCIDSDDIYSCCI